MASGQTWLSTLVPACLSLPLPVSLPWSSCLWPRSNLLGQLKPTPQGQPLDLFSCGSPFPSSCLVTLLFQDSVSLMKLSVCAGALGLSSQDSSLVSTGTLGVKFLRELRLFLLYPTGAHLGQGLCLGWHHHQSYR